MGFEYRECPDCALKMSTLYKLWLARRLPPNWCSIQPWSPHLKPQLAHSTVFSILYLNVWPRFYRQHISSVEVAKLTDAISGAGWSWQRALTAGPAPPNPRRAVPVWCSKAGQLMRDGCLRCSDCSRKWRPPDRSRAAAPEEGPGTFIPSRSHQRQ